MDCFIFFSFFDCRVGSFVLLRMFVFVSIAVLAVSFFFCVYYCDSSVSCFVLFYFCLFWLQFLNWGASAAIFSGITVVLIWGYE